MPPTPSPTPVAEIEAARPGLEQREFAVKVMRAYLRDMADDGNLTDAQSATLMQAAEMFDLLLPLLAEQEAARRDSDDSGLTADAVTLRRAASDLAAARERLSRWLCEPLPHGISREELQRRNDVNRLLGDGDDSARLEPKPEPEMTEAEAEAIWQEAERTPPSPESMQRVRDGVMRRLGFEPSAECETAWLIEADGPSWWTGRDASAGSFDADPNEAIRFARREDADRAKHWLLSDHAFALRTTEHVWLDAAIQSTPIPDGADRAE